VWQPRPVLIGCAWDETLLGVKSLFSWLGRGGHGDEPNGDAIRRIAAELDRLDPDRARYVASFAFVLSRVASVDDEVTPEEMAAMERLVAEKAALPADQAVLVVQMARQQQRLFGGTDDFLVTRDLAQSATYEQRLTIVECLFAVAAVDRRVHAAESNEIGRIATELRIEPTDLLRIRTQYRQYLAAREGLTDGTP
jgi:uncharacterized tellurite resistance protein B-like protein